MIKGKKSEYETSCVYGIDESRIEMVMAAVPTAEDCVHLVVDADQGRHDHSRGCEKARD